MLVEGECAYFFAVRLLWDHSNSNIPLTMFIHELIWLPWSWRVSQPDQQRFLLRSGRKHRNHEKVDWRKGRRVSANWICWKTFSELAPLSLCTLSFSVQLKVSRSGWFVHQVSVLKMARVSGSEGCRPLTLTDAFSLVNRNWMISY